jgi:hypothetical protein
MGKSSGGERGARRRRHGTRQRSRRFRGWPDGVFQNFCLLFDRLREKLLIKLSHKIQTNFACTARDEFEFRVNG